MTRHAKNQCTQAHYSQAERKADGYGSKKQRLGGESLLPFGTCCISLKPVVDPVVSKKGDLFSKAAIVEYLAYRKVQLQKQTELYDADQERQRLEADAAANEAKAAELEEFNKQEMGISTGKAHHFDTTNEKFTAADFGNRGAISAVSVDGQSVYVPEGEKSGSLKRPNPWAHDIDRKDKDTGAVMSLGLYREGGESGMKEVRGLDYDALQAKKLEVLQNERAQVKAFWIPAHIPSAPVIVKVRSETTIVLPTTQSRCPSRPVRGHVLPGNLGLRRCCVQDPKRDRVALGEQKQKHPWGDYSLKYKSLIPVNFTPIDKEKGQDTSHHEFENRFMCPITFKSFGRASKAVVLKPSGHGARPPPWPAPSLGLGD